MINEWIIKTRRNGMTKRERERDERWEKINSKSRIKMEMKQINQIKSKQKKQKYKRMTERYNKNKKNSVNKHTKIK